MKNCLHYAIQNANMDLVKLLIQIDSEQYELISSEDITGKIPIQYDKFGMFKEELETIWSVLHYENSQMLSHYIQTHPGSINQLTKSHNTPLHIAVKKKNISIVQTLVDHNCNIHAKNFKGDTPYDTAVNIGESSIAKLLLMVEKSRSNADIV
jgi:ankyrin repeat protein